MAFDAQGRWKPEDQSVATKLTGLLASDSPYIKLARQGGMDVANRRGLQNSSIAAGTSEAAAIGAAAPIAAQDASQIAQQNLSFQGAGQASDLSKQESGQTASLAQQQADAALRAQTQSEAAATAAAAAQHGYQTDEQKAAAEAQLTYGTTIQGMQGAQAQTQQQGEAAIAARAQAIDAVTKANDIYNSGFTSLANNADLPADTRAQYLQNLIDTRNSSFDMIQQVYGIKLDWGQGGAATVAPASVPAVATTAPAQTIPKAPMTLPKVTTGLLSQAKMAA